MLIYFLNLLYLLACKKFKLKFNKTILIKKINAAKNKKFFFFDFY